MPESFGIQADELSDVVRFGHGSGDAGQTTGAGVVLVAKICDALVNWGYGGEDVQKVGGLVARNVMTCDFVQVGREGGLDIDSKLELHEDGGEMEDARRRVELMLKRLLEKDVPRSRSVTMNSNEPVVLLNQSKRIGRAVFNRAVDETVTQLQQDWNIWPVRVYAGPYLAMPGDGFSVTLLNVVNTDIGGPSMVQLLDAACDAPEWRGFVRREAWRERDLLYREEGKGLWVEEDTAWDDASEHSSQSDEDGSLDSEPASLATLETPTIPESLLQEGQSAGEEMPPAPVQEDCTPLDASPKLGHVSPVAGPEPEEIPLPQEPDVPERRIEHPTWERPQDTMSLLDLIRSQASLLVPFGKEDPAMEEKADSPVEEPDSAKEESPIDDGAEFVLV